MQPAGTPAQGCGGGARRTDSCFLLVHEEGALGLGFPSLTEKLFPFTKRHVITLGGMGGTWRSGIRASLGWLL